MRAFTEKLANRNTYQNLHHVGLYAHSKNRRNRISTRRGAERIGQTIDVSDLAC